VNASDSPHPDAYWIGAMGAPSNSEKDRRMNSHIYSTLIHYKQWADRGLYEVVCQEFDRLNTQDRHIVLRVLDHIHTVDRIFQHHLCEMPHSFHAPRSDEMPDIRALAEQSKQVDDWYVSYVDGVPAQDFEQPVEFAFTNGAPARMTRGEIILHICLHGTYHRGNAGLVLQTNGIAPNNDRVTDFVQADDERPLIMRKCVG
jgi:uncharacterized damage-inducible protein DinB